MTRCHSCRTWTRATQLNAALFAPFAEILMDDLKYANLQSRGYVYVTFGPDEVSSEWRYVSAIDTTDYSLDDDLTKGFTVSRSDLLLA